MDLSNEALSIALVATGVGATCLPDCLASLAANPWADEVVLAIDHVGRANGDPSQLVDLAVLDQYPQVRQAHNRHFDDWAITNQTINIGIQATTARFIMITHEDVIWQKFDYIGVLRRWLDWLSLHRFRVDDHRIVGLTLPAYEHIAGIRSPYWDCEVGITQCYSPTCTLIARRAWEEIGAFSETNGIWYDGILQEEMRRRGWWCLYLNVPPPDHLGNRSYKPSGWGKGFSLVPLWGNYEASFAARYGKPSHRADFCLPLAKEWWSCT